MSIAEEYNSFFWWMVAVCGFVTIAIAACILVFGILYRRKDPNELPPQIDFNKTAEVMWIAIPFVAFMGMFGAGTKLYLNMRQPPPGATEIYVVGKQWMWKLQHSGGQREIDELHIPVGQPILLKMTSEDVIHSFFVPEFRVKQDVLPKRYTTVWFQAEKPGRYHLLCAEYCGTNHSGMKGWVYAMSPHDYQIWLEQGGAEGSLSSSGEKLFHQFACANCHYFDGHGYCPNLQGLYMRPVRLSTGESVTADDTYIRESILDPKAKIVQGFQDLMPTFKGQITEEQVIELIAYIKSIGPQPGSELQSSGYEGSGTQPPIAKPPATQSSGKLPEAR